jgi:hypothetical protein
MEINEKSTATLTLSFYDSNTTPVTPISLSYKIMNKDSGFIIHPWSTVTPTTSTYDLTLTSNDNTMVSINKDYEDRILTIRWEYEGETGTDEFNYRVINLKGM